MLKHTITFDDLDGNKVTEDFYFNISKAELAEMEIIHSNASTKSGYANKLEQIAAKKEGKELLESFKEILRMSVGRRSEDGKRFIKSEEIADAFFQTDAYTVLFMELFTDTNAAINFFKAIVPADMLDGVDSAVAKVTAPAETPSAVEGPPLDTPPGPIEDTRPAWIREDRDPTSKEVQSMTPEQLREAFARKQSKG